MNLRIAKVIGFGRERGGAPSASGGDAHSGGGAGNPVQAATGRGLGGVISTPTTSHRFNLSIGLSIRNLLNHTNPGPIIGNITSPYFGLANQIAGGQNGEGFYETANNRRLESQIKFTFWSFAMHSSAFHNRFREAKSMRGCFTDLHDARSCWRRVGW